MKDKYPAVLLLSHGPLCEGMKASAEMIFGKTDRLEALELKAGENPEEYEQEILTMLDHYENNVFVLVDILGGTPFNTVAKISRERRVYGMAGMSMPMVLEILSDREDYSGKELAEMAMENLAAGKVNLCDFFENAYQK